MSDWTKRYTDKEHAAALGDMVRDMQTVVVTPCPKCGEPMEYEGPTTEGDPLVIGGMHDLAGGWACPECGHFIADEEPDNED